MVQDHGAVDAVRAVLELQARKRLGPVTPELRQVVETAQLPEANQLLRVGTAEYVVTGVVWELLGAGGKAVELQPRVYAERQVP